MRGSKGGGGESHYLRSNFLSQQAIGAIDKTVGQLRSSLTKAGLVGLVAGSAGVAASNKHSDNMALVKGVSPLRNVPLEVFFLVLLGGLPRVGVSKGGGVLFFAGRPRCTKIRLSETPHRLHHNATFSTSCQYVQLSAVVRTIAVVCACTMLAHALNQPTSQASNQPTNKQTNHGTRAGLVAAALYPNAATIASVKNKVDPGAPPKCELRAADMYGKKASKKGKEHLDGKTINIHPSSVLLGAQTRLAALARAESETQHPPFVVFHGRMKTTRDYITDGSIVYPMQLVLFAGTNLGVEKQAIFSDEVPTVRITLDRWLTFTTSQMQADLVLALRRELAQLLQSAIDTGGFRKGEGNEDSASITSKVDGSLERDRIVAVAAGLVQTSGGGDDDTGQPLPDGWRAQEDPSSSLGKMLYYNRHTRAAQRQRPTMPAPSHPLPPAQSGVSSTTNPAVSASKGTVSTKGGGATKGGGVEHRPTKRVPVDRAAAEAEKVGFMTVALFMLAWHLLLSCFRDCSLGTSTSPQGNADHDADHDYVLCLCSNVPRLKRRPRRKKRPTRQNKPGRGPNISTGPTFLCGMQNHESMDTNTATVWKTLALLCAF